jgi:hypothetical protein
MAIKLGPWISVGDVRLSVRGRPTFPDAPADPGLYRLLVRGADRSFYVGQTDGLARALERIAAGHRSQETNARLHRWLRDDLVAGGTAEVEVCTSGIETARTTTRDLDLFAPSDRALAKAEALLASREAGLGREENRAG